MTDEELKYYKALQPLFREKIGEWRPGDLFITTYTGEVKCCSSTWGMYGNHIVDENSVEWLVDDCLFLPLPIDPRNPERGLWGMINRRYGLSLHEYNEIFMLDAMHGEIFESATPNLALLKALAVQEGVRVCQ